MRHLTLTSRIDAETGELGYCFDDMPRIDYPTVAIVGLLLAHDVLEHQRGLHKIGTIGDELIALGGVWYVRGQHGEISRNGHGSMHSPEQHIASDVVNMGRMYICGGMRLHIKVPKRLPSCDNAESIREIIRCSIEGLRSELQGEPVDGGRMAKYLRMAERLMKKGYNMAKRRFETGERSRYFANNQFWSIAEALDPYVSSPEFEGSRLRLSYGEGSATVREIYEQEDY